MELKLPPKLSFPPLFALITIALTSTLEGMQKYILSHVSILKIYLFVGEIANNFVILVISRAVSSDGLQDI